MSNNSTNPTSTISKSHQYIIDCVKEAFPHQDFIPLHEPYFSDKEKDYVLDCINSTFVSSVGKYVDTFENNIKAYLGSPFAIAMSNGTSALHIALILANVCSDDEVITQPLTFVATCNAISYCNAKPTFVDINPNTLGLCPQKLDEFLKHNTKKTAAGLVNTRTGRTIKACVPMHTFGHPCQIDDIVNICNQYTIPVIEDAAESLGSTYKTKHTGTFGSLGIFSFNGNKAITSGGGGVLVTNNEGLAKKAKHLSTTAKVAHPWDYVHDEIGYNYRMPNLNAALGCAQLEKLNDLLKSKQKLASIYKEKFKHLDLTFFTQPKHSQSNYWLNALIFKNKTERDAFLLASNQNKVMTRPCWTLMHQLELYKNCFKADLTESEAIASCLVNIPSSGKL